MICFWVELLRSTANGEGAAQHHLRFARIAAIAQHVSMCGCTNDSYKGCQTFSLIGLVLGAPQHAAQDLFATEGLSLCFLFFSKIINIRKIPWPFAIIQE